MPLRIGIAGISGRMGQMLTEEVIAAGATLVGGIDRPGMGAKGAKLFSDIGALAAPCDLVIDFTHASTVAGHARALAAAGVAWVLGTTGLSAADEAAIAEAASKIPVIAAPNYSPGVNLMFAIAERLGAALPAETYDAEIVEMHHRQKVDAPSGTALGIGRAVAAGRDVVLAEVMVCGRMGRPAPARTGKSALRPCGAARLSAATRFPSPPPMSRYRSPIMPSTAGHLPPARSAPRCGCRGGRRGSTP